MNYFVVVEFVVDFAKIKFKKKQKNKQKYHWKTQSNADGIMLSLN
jgi:hypothetical protein